MRGASNGGFNIGSGQDTMMAAFEECLQKAGVTAEETAYMGDDLLDMPLAARAGLAVAVANAAVEPHGVEWMSSSHPEPSRRGSIPCHPQNFVIKMESWAAAR